jgi:thiamine pyrophosphate-dependent acetolactate synthase large subunit-like protein
MKSKRNHTLKKLVKYDNHKKIISPKGTYTELFWNYLVDKKIKKVWGLTGQGISYLINYTPTEIKYLNTHNELQNTWSAQVYGRLTNNVGFSFTTTGPGVATALSALKNAVCEKNPLILCSPYDHENTQVDFQSWNIYEVGKTMCETFYISKPEEFLKILNKAYYTALIKQTGVLLLVKSNLFLQKVTNNSLKIESSLFMDDKSKIQKYSLNMNKNLNDKNMLIILGKGSTSRPNLNLEKFIKTNNIPYIVTWNERQVMDGGLYCGRIGTLGNHSANYAMYHATHVLIIGDTAASMVNQVFAPMFNILFLNNNKKIYTISNDQQFKLPQKSNFIVVNDNEYIFSLFDFKPNGKWINQLQESNHHLLVPLHASTKYEKFCKIAADIYSKQNLDIPVTTGVGNHWTCIGKYFEIKKSIHFETQCVWDSIGTGIANGIAMYHALNKPVWVFEGDGGTFWGGSNLLYLLNNKHLPITVTIYVNHIYGMIEEYNYEANMDPKSIPLQIKESIPLIEHYPNVHIFDKYAEYENYLSKNPISNDLRFIFINLGNNPIENSVFEINVDKEYIKDLHKSNYNDILNSLEVLKTDYVYF